MNYPDDFYTPTFPAGKSVALSRVMGIGILSVFLIIVCMCGLLLWTVRSMRVEPYILATGGINDQWRVIHTKKQQNVVDPNYLFQQFVIWRFTENWFTISPNHDENNMIWNDDCKIEDCMSSDTPTKKCALFCLSDTILFKHFSQDVLPGYRSLESVGSTWMPELKSVRIEPVSTITSVGGTWRIQLTVLLDKNNRAMDIIAYADVNRNIKHFPSTFGYYVKTFNAYRISQ